MTRARAKFLQAKVNSLLSLCDFDTPLDGLLLHTHTLCIIRYEEKDQGTEEKQPVAARRKRYYRLSRPVLPLQAVLPAPATGRTRNRYYRSRNRYYRTAVLPLPPTARHWRLRRKLQALKRYYRSRS